MQIHIYVFPCILVYNDEYFCVLHRDKTKQHLTVVMPFYILFYKPTLCKQNPKYSLNLNGDNCCLILGGF